MRKLQVYEHDLATDGEILSAYLNIISVIKSDKHNQAANEILILIKDIVLILFWTKMYCSFSGLIKGY